MTPTSALASLTPAARPHGKKSAAPQAPGDASPEPTTPTTPTTPTATDFAGALALLLSGQAPVAAQPQASAADGQTTPAPSTGATEIAAVGPTSGSLTVGQAAASRPVVVPGAAAPIVPSAGAAAPGKPARDGGDPPGSDHVPPSTLAPAGEPVAAGLRGLTPAKDATESGDAHRPSISQLPPTARPGRAAAPDGPHGDPPVVGSEGEVPATTIAALVPTPSLPSTTTVLAADTTTTTTVLRQVFPEITRVATTPGTHRISITLHPESLGEVRVTVVVRAGGVQVHLAADAAAPDSAQARQALLQGAPDLHRLLALTAGDAKVTVQGAPADPTSQNPGQQSQSQAQTHAQAQSQAGEGQRRPSYTPPGAHDLPQSPDRPIGGTTTTTARSAARVDENAGRLDRLM